MKKEKLILLIDGTSMLVNAYHESCPVEVINAKSVEEKGKAFELLEKNEDGLYIGAVRGLFYTILDAIDKINPTHIVVVWGTSRKTNIRKELYSDYKADDSVMDEPLREQFKTAQVLLSPLVKQYTSKQYEAIDLIATISKKFYKEADIKILARNSNYLQLASIADVYIKSSKSYKLNEEFEVNLDTVPLECFKYDARNVRIVKGLGADEIVEFNALVGSSSSGIPGVKGVGIVTALPLIKKYHKLEDIYNMIDNYDNKELAKLWKDSLGIRNPINKLILDRENAFLSRKLCTAIDDVMGVDDNIECCVKFITRDNTAKELKRVGLLSRHIWRGESEILSSLVEHLNISSNDSKDTPFFDGLNVDCEYYDNIEDCSYEINTTPVMEDVDCYALEFMSSENCNDEDYIDEFNMEYEDNCDIEDSIDDDREYINDIVDNVNKTETLTLIETLVIKKYLCNHCGNVITIVGGSTPKFCIECGQKQNDIRREVNIDNLEDTRCTLKDIKRRNNIESKLIV